jgi:Asp-tRNA(Asn)/Glu-tRNA(Gln) amidotransferase A subunit family amidase
MPYLRSIDRKPFTSRIPKFLEGESTPREYLEECIEAIDHCEQIINAFECCDIEGARKAADASTDRYRSGRPLSFMDGMPVAVKDIIDTCNMPTRMNSGIFATYAPKCDAASVRVALDGGCVVVGKTATTEFAIGRSANTVNPHNIKHTPGGSSSGSAAGVAAGMFSAGFGTQTQGSIIRPASFCGIVGFKPTVGALSTDGVHPLSRTLDHLGALGESIDEVWALCRWVSEYAPGPGLNALSGPMEVPVPPLPLQRVAVLRTSGFGEMESDSYEAFEQLVTRVKSAGADVAEPRDDPALGAVVDVLDQVPEKSLDILSYEMRWPFLGYMEHHEEKLGARIVELIERSKEISREKYITLLAFRDDLRRSVDQLSDRYDAFLLPSASGPAPEGLEHTGSRTFLVYWTFIGFPAYSLPMMSVRGLPFGLQIAGFDRGDYRLTRQAKWIAGMVDGRSRGVEQY